jgi:hypothetical protein
MTLRRYHTGKLGEPRYKGRTRDLPELVNDNQVLGPGRQVESRWDAFWGKHSVTHR